MKVEIKGIEVQMGDKAIKLTVEQAKELRKQLNELFGEKIVHVPSSSIVVEREVWPWWRYYTTTPNPYPQYPLITCQGNATSPESIQVFCCAEDN